MLDTIEKSKSEQSKHR